jgi:CRP/FNR family transcriptional regulator, cyclic AMP receptor protein
LCILRYYKDGLNDAFTLFNGGATFVKQSLVGGPAIEAEEKTKLLSAVDLLEPLSLEEVERLGRRIPEVRFQRGQILYTPAHQAKVLFVLLRGRMRIYKVAKGRELTLNVVVAGETFGEAAFVARRRQGAYAQALEPSEVGLMSRDTLGNLVRDKPEVGLKAMELLGERMSFYESKMADIGLKEVPARLASLILHLCESEGVVTAQGYVIPTGYTHQQLGSMIGAKRVAVTRAMKEFRRIGAVEPTRKQIHVKDVPALEYVAGRQPTAEERENA